jgi:hypothetical protein
LISDVFITPGAARALDESMERFEGFLSRHERGDWGDLGDEDKRENDFALGRELRIFSAYHTANGEKVWIVTEADRSATTILLPNEY